MMLSTVNILAVGETGEENLNLLVDGEVVESWVNVSDQGETLTWESDATLTADQIRIEFTNDLYLPDQGIDRNLIVTELQIDGRKFRSDDPSVFSTGTWKQGDGVTPGFRQSNVLHTNGYFQYAETEQRRTIDFDNATWAIDGNSLDSGPVTVDPNSGILTISGVYGAVSIAREVDVVGGELFDFNVDSWRQVIAGEFASDNQPWASAGINFYSVSGQQVGQQQIDLNTPRNGTDDGFRSVEQVAPENADRAFLWIWVDGFGAGDNIPLHVRDINYDQVDLSDDTTPPTVELVPFTYTGNGRSEINFAIDFADDQRLGTTAIDAIAISGPDGFEETALQRTGQPGNTDTFQRIIYGLVAPDGLWDKADNGVYTVLLNPKSVSDQAGNFTERGVLGTFEVDITPLPVDTTPPQVVLFDVPEA